MRMWKGIEREGREKGVVTLFVECEHVDDRVIEEVKGVAQKNEITRIYFGAGKKDVLSMCAWEKTLKHYNVIVETTAQHLDRLAERSEFSEIILRTEISSEESVTNIFPKIETAHSVSIYYNRISNTTADVSNGIYTETDKLLYEE